MPQSVNISHDFEVVDSASIEYVKRGRKSNVDPELVNKLKTLPVGKSLTVRKMAQNPDSPTYASDKGRVGAQIRNACKSAGITTFSIRWSVDGIPAIVR